MLKSIISNTLTKTIDYYEDDYKPVYDDNDYTYTYTYYNKNLF